MHPPDGQDDLQTGHDRRGVVDRPVSPELVRGAAELERTERGWLPHRLPARARAQCADPQLLGAESQPSGVRLALRTRATVLELDLVRTRVVLAGLAPRPDGVVDFVVDGVLVARSTTSGGDVVHVDPVTGVTRVECGGPGTVRVSGLPGHDKDVEVWLPQNERIEVVALRTDAPVAPTVGGGRRVWLHHGSSISQGSGAAGPSTTWPAVAASAAGVELVNLGLGGSALLDQFTARAMRDTPADLLSVKIGINLVNLDLLRLRAFGPAVHGFLDTLRDGHPDMPLLVVGPTYCPIHEDTPGPGAFDRAGLAAGQLRFVATGDPAGAAVGGDPQGKLTLAVVREQLAAIVASRVGLDPNLSYLDGQVLYGDSDFAERPLPDALHPDAATHQVMGERFARVALARGGPLAPPGCEPDHADPGEERRKR